MTTKTERPRSAGDGNRGRKQNKIFRPRKFNKVNPDIAREIAKLALHDIYTVMNRKPVQLRYLWPDPRAGAFKYG